MIGFGAKAQVNVVNYDDSLPPIAEGNKKMTATFHSRMSMG